MLRTEVPILIGLVLVTCSAPFLPTPILLTLDWLIVRILTVMILLSLVSVGPFVGIFGFVAIAVLYMERNRRKVQHGLKRWDELDATSRNYATVEEASQPQKTVPVVPFDEPRETQTEYAPEDDTMDISVFEPVGPSLNERVVMSSSYPVGHQASSSTASMESIYEQMGVGHVRGVETVA
jgi:hypothetical protein